MLRIEKHDLASIKDNELKKASFRAKQQNINRDVVEESAQIITKARDEVLRISMSRFLGSFGHQNGQNFHSCHVYEILTFNLKNNKLCDFE